MAHFQGRSEGIFCAYRATDGKRLWDFDAGTGIMAPPVTYLQDVVQYITLMVGWGGAAALANIPGGGPIKRGYSSVLTFSVRRLLDGMDGKGRKTPDVHFTCNCLILGEVARPERFELPAFWFVARSAKNHKCRYWYRLRATRATLFCP